MAITWADVEAIAPELSTAAAGLQAIVLGYVNEQLDDAADGWDDGALYTLAGAFLAAHFASGPASGAGASGARGPVTSMALGAASKSFASPSFTMASGALSGTSYGQQYLALAQARFAGGFLT